MVVSSWEDLGKENIRRFGIDIIFNETTIEYFPHYYTSRCMLIMNEYFLQAKKYISEQNSYVADIERIKDLKVIVTNIGPDIQEYKNIYVFEISGHSIKKPLEALKNFSNLYFLIDKIACGSLPYSFKTSKIKVLFAYFKNIKYLYDSHFPEKLDVLSLRISASQKSKEKALNKIKHLPLRSLRWEFTDKNQEENIDKLNKKLSNCGYGSNVIKTSFCDINLPKNLPELSTLEELDTNVNLFNFDNIEILSQMKNLKRLCIYAYYDFSKQIIPSNLPYTLKQLSSLEILFIRDDNINYKDGQFKQDNLAALQKLLPRTKIILVDRTKSE